MRILKAVALICVGMVVGGGAYAGADSLVTSKSIQNGSIRCVDLRPALCKQIGQTKVEVVAGPRGPRGFPGETGPMGPVGPKGEKGDKGDPASGPITTPPPTPPTDKTVAVTSMTGDWSTQAGTCATGTTGNVGLYLDYLIFGYFGNGNEWAKASYSGLGGTLKDITGLSYRSFYEFLNEDKHTGQPALRIVTDEGTVEYNPPTPQDADVTGKYEVVGSEVSYNGAKNSWASVVAAHGSEQVREISFYSGCDGADSNGLLVQIDELVTISKGQRTTWDFKQ